jgi:hypothetical protein
MKVLMKRPYVAAAFQFYYAELVNYLRGRHTMSTGVLVHTMRLTHGICWHA